MATLKVDHREAYPTCLWTSVAGSLLGACQFGYQVGVLNTALPFITKDLHYHRDALLSSAVVLGAAFGAMCAGKLADQLGPRHAQVLNCLVFLVGSVLSAASTAHHLFFAGRFVAGIGAGAASLLVPRYITEISPVALRGRLGSLNQVLINTGILAAYCAGIPYEKGFTGFHVLGCVWISWWRVMNALGLAPAVLQVLVLSWCPESPVWLEGAAKRDAADEACMRLWGAHALLADPDYEADAARAADLITSASEQLVGQTSFLTTPLLASHFFAPPGLTNTAVLGQQPYRYVANGHQQIRPGPGRAGSLQRGISGDTVSVQGRQGVGSVGVAVPTAAALHSSAPGLNRSMYGQGGDAGSERQRLTATGSSNNFEGWECLFARRYRLMMALAIGLPLLQQASGINTVVFYSSKVFADAGLSSPIAASIITGGVNLAFTVAAAAVLDRYGRKPLLLVSYIGMAAALAAVAAVACLSGGGESPMTLVLLVLAYVACFAVGSGPVTWVMLSEVLPARIKGPAASAATAISWTGNLVVTLSFDGLLRHLGLGGTYLMYAIFNASAAAYVAGLVVETRCRSLAEVEELLLLPDTGRRLAALWPSLQRHQQQQQLRADSGGISDRDLNGADSTGRGSIYGAVNQLGNAGSSNNLYSLYDNNSNTYNSIIPAYPGEQQVTVTGQQQQAGCAGVLHSGYSCFAGNANGLAAVAHLPIGDYAVAGGAAAAAATPFHALSSGGWDAVAAMADSTGLLPPTLAAAAAASGSVIETTAEGLPLPTALMPGDQESPADILVRRREFVADWAQTSAEAAAAAVAEEAAVEEAVAAAMQEAAAAAAAESMQNGELLLGAESGTADNAAREEKIQHHADEEQQQEQQQEPEQQLAQPLRKSTSPSNGVRGPDDSAAHGPNARQGQQHPQQDEKRADPFLQQPRARPRGPAPGEAKVVITGFDLPPKS